MKLKLVYIIIAQLVGVSTSYAQQKVTSSFNKELNLSKEQASQITAIKDQYQQQIQHLTMDTIINPRLRSLQIRKLIEERNKTIQLSMSSQQQRVLQTHISKRANVHTALILELNLNAEQQKQLAAQDRYNQQIKQLISHPNLQPREKEQQIRQLEAERNEKLKSVLTAQQQLKLQQIMQSRMNERDTRRQESLRRIR